MMTTMNTTDPTLLHLLSVAAIEHDPTNLREIWQIAEQTIGRERTNELVEQCIVALVKSGRRPILFRPETATWEWTTLLNGPEARQEESSPEMIAETAVFRQQAFGDADLFWLGTEVPPTLNDYFVDRHMRHHLEYVARHMSGDKLTQLINFARTIWGQPKVPSDWLGKQST
jgi:hypothetical protein